MSEMDEEIIDEPVTTEVSSLHIETNECSCSECQKVKETLCSDS